MHAGASWPERATHFAEESLPQPRNVNSIQARSRLGELRLADAGRFVREEG